MNAAHDVTDLGLRDAILNGQVALPDLSARVSRSNLQHLSRRQFVVSAVASFSHTIAVVVTVCPYKEMCRITASSIITVMKDTKALWDRAPCVFIGHSMRVSSDTFANGNLTIPANIDSAGPGPTSQCAGRPINAFIEAFVKWARRISHARNISLFYVENYSTSAALAVMVE